MSPSARLFVILMLAGLAGVLSFQLVDFAALVAMLPHGRGELPFPMAVVRILSFIQLSVFVAAAVFVGLKLSPKVGLSAPAAEALADGRAVFPGLRPQLIPGLIGGVIGGFAIIASWLLWKPHLPAAFLVRAAGFNDILPVVTRFFYGGITEEVLLRWGLMTVLVWASWRVFQRGRRNANTGSFVLAIILSSVVFGIGHLPIAIALNDDNVTLPLVTYVVTANSIFGFIAGYLYWKKGLESAIVAHMAAHAVMVTVLRLVPSLDRI